MRRGFKAWAEDEALRIRGLLELDVESRLPANVLASHLKVIILTPNQIPGLLPGDLAQLLKFGREEWSAATIDHQEQRIIIINSSHSRYRQESSLMHELAHLICEHEPASSVSSDGLAMRTFDPNQEKEAAWLGGCLQIPRSSLKWAVDSGMQNFQISNHFGASTPLVIYRRRVTGIDIQLARKGNKPTHAPGRASWS